MSYDFNRAIQIFKDAVSNQYWDVDGRTSRSDFWHYASIVFVIWIVISVINAVIPVIGALLSLAMLALIPPNIGVGIRRMHDQGKAWWFFLIPFYNLYLYCMPGDVGPNQFGEDPLGGSAAVFE